MTPDTIFAQLNELQSDKKLPPVHLWQPERVGEIDICINQQGEWLHEGQVFQRQAIVDLFATILRKDGDAYYLVTPAEKLRIAVEDVPFVAVDMDVRGKGRDTDLLFTTNVGDYVMADADHPLEMRGDQPYLHVRDNLYARLTRNVFYRLVDQGLEEDGALAVYSQGTRFDMGSTQA